MIVVREIENDHGDLPSAFKAAVAMNRQLVEVQAMRFATGPDET